MSTFRITQENITDILELHQDGKSNIEVGTAVGFSGVHIGRVLKCYKLHGEEVLRQNPSLSTPVERLGREINEIIEFLFCYRIPRELVSIIFLVPSSALNEAYYQRLRTGKRLATQIAKVPHTVNQEELDKLIRRYNKNKSPEDCRKEYMAQIRSQVCMEESASDDGYVTGFQISARKLPEGLKDFVPTGNKIEDTIAIFKMGGRPVDLTRILNTHQAEASRTITFLKIHGPDEYRRLPTLSEPGGYSWDCILAIVEFCLATGALPSQAARIFKTTDATLKRAIKVRQRTIAPDVRLNVAALLPGTNLIEAEKTVKMPFGESFSSLIKAYLAGRDPMPPYNRQVTTSSGTAAEAEAAAGAAEAAAAGKVTATSAADCAAAEEEAAAGAAEGAEADSGASAEAAEETATGAPEGAEADSDAAAEACEETATSAAEGFEAGEENVTGAAEGSEAGEETATGAPEGAAADSDAAAEAGEETATSAADCAAADAEAAAGAAEGAEADSDAAAEACEETATSAADCTAADAEAAAGAAEGAEADSGAAAEAGEETATSAADCAAAEAAEETATGAPEGAAADSDAAAEACEETATSAAEGFEAGEENVTGAAEGAAADSDAAAEACEETATSAAEGFEAGEETATGAPEGAAADSDAAAEAGEENVTGAAEGSEAGEETATGAAEGAAADSDAAAEACEETATSAAEGFEAGEENVTGAAEGSEAGEETATGAAEGSEAGEETATGAAEGSEAGEETATGAAEGAAADSDAAAEACEETATSAAEGFGAGEENVTGAAEGAAAEDGKETATGTAAGAPWANADGMVNIQATEIHCEGAGEMPLEQCKPVERTKGNATAVPKPRPKPKINISHAQAESNKQKRIIDAMKNGIEIESLSGAATPRAPEKLDLPAYMLENYGIDPGIPASEYRPVSGKKGRPQKIDVMSKGFDKLPLDVQNSQMKRYVNELLSALEGQKKIVELSELEINPYMERGDRRQLLVDAYHETVERLKVLGVKPVKGVLKRIFNFSSSELFYYDKVRPNLESNNLRMSQISDAVDEILTIYIREEGAIGPAQMQLQLSDEYGTNFSLYKVRRLMRLYGLDWLVLRSEKKYSSYLGTWALCGDLIRRDFYSDRPGIKIVTDITEFKCSNGKLYLCTFMDLWNKEILSWTISSSPSQIFVMKALNELMQYLPDDEDIIIHSDQGHHYQHESYLEFFEQRPKMHRSMSRKGNSPDNGAMESFFSILKNLLHGEMAFSQLTDVELRDKINQKIRNYNNIRALRWNSGVSPAARRAKWLNDNQWFIISGNGPAVVQTDDSTNAGSNVVASA